MSDNTWRAVTKEYLGLTLVLLALVVIFSLSTSNFFSLTTFRTIANQIPDALVLAVGMTLVLLSAEIDLSVGSVLALSGAVLGVCLVDFKLPLPLAILACLLTGTVCGLVNGAIVIRWKLPAFIVTLGMLEVARGAAYLLTKSQTKYIGAPIETPASYSLFGLSLSFLFALGCVLLAQFFLRRSVYGRYLMAVGANENAARYAGIDPRVVKITVFAICGFLSATAALMQTARLVSADPNAGTGAELQGIAAAVIGGTSLLGGRGSIVSTFIGVLIIAVLGAGLSQLGVQEPTKRVVTGSVIVIAVILDYYRSH